MRNTGVQAAADWRCWREEEKAVSHLVFLRRAQAAKPHAERQRQFVCRFDVAGPSCMANQDGAGGGRPRDPGRRCGRIDYSLRCAKPEKWEARGDTDTTYSGHTTTAHSGVSHWSPVQRGVEPGFNRACMACRPVSRRNATATRLSHHGNTGQCDWK